MNESRKSMRRGAGEHNPVLRFLSSAVDFIVLLALLAVLLFAVYSLWDSHKVYAAADSTQYESYKPEKQEDGPSFTELRNINPDVFGWLTVYDTKIDYPLLKPKNNDDYLSTNPLGKSEASGSIFIDCRNQADFSDFNTIIFGHHMAERAMFGDLDLFLKQDFFNSHEYGNLYYGGKNHGIQFFAMLQASAYDSLLYTPAVTGSTRQQYLDHIYSTALYTRNVSVTPEDHIVLLSTCSADITNGRFILVGKVLDHEVANPFPADTQAELKKTHFSVFDLFDKALGLPVGLWILILLAAIALTAFGYRASRKHTRRKYEA